VAKEKDDDADRDPESKGEIHERWEEKGEISRRYIEAKSKLPDDPRDDPWAYTGLLSRNPAKNITPPLWEAIKSEGYRVYRWSVERDRYDDLETPEHRLAKALGKVQLRHYYWSKGKNEDLTENLDGEDATRLYLFFDLSALNQSEGARAINDPDIQEALGIEDDPRDLRIPTEPPETRQVFGDVLGPVGVPQTPTDSRDPLLNRIAVFSTTGTPSQAESPSSWSNAVHRYAHRKRPST